MHERRIVERERVGLPEKGTSSPVVYSFAERCLVVEVALTGLPPRHALYLRRATEERYALIGPPGPLQSFQSPILFGEDSIVFLVVNWRPEGDSFGGRPEGLRRLSLRTGEEPEPLLVDDILPTGAFFSSLLRGGEGGNLIDCVLGFRESSGRVRYFVCRLELQSRQLVKGAELEGVSY